MVIGLAARTAGKIGTTMMRGGAKIAGASKARSTAGSILATKKNQEILKKIERYNLAANTYLTGIQKNTAKTAGLLSLYSPALKQQLTVLKKSFEIFLRPIGDIIARYVAPMAIIVMKAALKWYKMISFGKDMFAEKETTSMAKMEDQTKQLLFEREQATLRGDDSAVAEVDRQLQSIYEKSIEQISKAGRFEIDLTEKQKDEMMGIENKYWDEIKVIATTSRIEQEDQERTKQSNLLQIQKDGHAEQEKEWSSLLDDLVNQVSERKKMITVRGKDIDTSKAGWYTTLPTDNEEGFSFGGGSSEGSSGVTGSFASGGGISKTGLYKLHAGEYVSNAGNTNRATNTSSINVSNNFIITASINSDIDIRELADKLASLNETELRRRIS